MKKDNSKAAAGVKEIARLAQVSIATVDRVIHNREGVSEKTKARIREIMKKLNYQPNVLARRLALASRGNLRLVTLLPVTSPETAFWEAPKEGIDQAENEIRQYGIKVERLFFDQNNEATFKKQVKKIIRSAPDGILLTPTFSDTALELIDYCKESGIPYVLINTDIPGFNAMCYIGPENFHSGYVAAQLVNYGIREGQKIVITKIAQEIDTNYSILRKEEGFRTYFKDNQLPYELITFDSKDTDYEIVARHLTKLLKNDNAIGAIFVTNSRVSLVARCLEKAGLKHLILLGYDFIPDNVSYLQSGTINFLICEKPREQGYRGIITLFQHLVYDQPVETEYLMPIEIVTKENCRYYRN